jgi:hypothetical protein
MNNERKPLLSDKDIDRLGPCDVSKHPVTGEYQYVRVPLCAEEVRDYYEHLIDEGKLRVVEEADAVSVPSFTHGEIQCSKCEGRLGNTYADALPNYCHRCGNKIKRA